MGKICVLAEKPSVGRDLARVLGCTKNGNGCIEGEKYIVTWALGHLVTLADPEAYGNDYKSWRIEDLPMIPDELELVVIGQTAKQYQVVKQLLRRSDVTKIIIATDAGREGELVARWILEKAKVNKPLQRLWISSVTDKAIRQGFEKLKDGCEYENLYASAAARAASDWYVGINATRALTCKFNAQLSCGRVQTPTLAIIAAREKEIQAFVPQKYYGITAKSQGISFTWQEKTNKGYHSFDLETVRAHCQELDGKKARIKEIKRTAKKEFSPQLYNLTELQRDANRLFAYSAKETLGIMQKLYENHKVLSYPRTDSRFISADIVPTLKERLKACGIGPYTKAAFVASKHVHSNPHFVDDAKVSDHHAIIPTEQFVNMAAFTDKERKIYDLVVRRFIAVLYPPFEYEQTIVQVEIGTERFVAHGKIIKNSGWKEVYQNACQADAPEGTETLRDQALPQLALEMELPILHLEMRTGETKPPAPFNEGSLLAAMENPTQYMRADSKDLRQMIGETGGLGTVATRADIIEKLFSSFVIEKRGKDIFTTPKGRQLLELVPSELREPALTAKWEQKLSAIAAGKLGQNVFIGDIKTYTRALVQQIKNSTAKFRHDNITHKKCPECGRFLLEVNGKQGKMLVCQDRSCGYRKSVSRQTNARCPNCHKKMELRGDGESKAFFCKCGYREKLQMFQKRREQAGGKVSKNEVSKYLREQQSAEPVNTALADALAQLKLK